MRRVIVVAAFVLALGAQRAWACQVAGNLILNCGFPTNSLVNWQFTGTPTHEPNDGSSALGSVNIVAGPSGGNSAVSMGSSCVSVNENTPYGYGIDRRLISGSPTFCELRVNFFSAAACAGVASFSAVTLFTPTGSWEQVSNTANSGAGAVTGNLGVLCTAPAGTPFTMRFDDAFLGVGLEPVELQSFSVQ